MVGVKVRQSAVDEESWEGGAAPAERYSPVHTSSAVLSCHLQDYLSLPQRLQSRA